MKMLRIIKYKHSQFHIIQECVRHWFFWTKWVFLDEDGFTTSVAHGYADKEEAIKAMKHFTFNKPKRTPPYEVIAVQTLIKIG